jgi:hypothetical protein
VGYAADERIKVTVKDGAAQSGLTLAIRMYSATLAESIVEVARPPQRTCRSRSRRRWRP